MKCLKLVFVSIFCLVSFIALADNELEPQRGGQVQEAHHLAFELVSKDNELQLYIRDHGTAYDLTNITGTITILAQGERTQHTWERNDEFLSVEAEPLETGDIIMVNLNRGQRNFAVRFRW